MKHDMFSFQLITKNLLKESGKRAINIPKVHNINFTRFRLDQLFSCINELFSGQFLANMG